MVMFSLWIHKFNVGSEYLLVGETVYLLVLSQEAKTVLKSAK